MHIKSKNDTSPLVSPHGEIIYELIGRAVGETTERHSLAYIVLPPGKASLLHYHPVAEESYYILQGNARLLLGEAETTLSPGQTVLIPPLKPHKIFNIGETDLEFLAICAPAWEASNSVYLEE